MKTTILVEKEVELKKLRVEAGVRYWEDATVNGEEDTEGKFIPFRQGDYWCPVIDLETGKVIGWPEGTTAQVHYKVCDSGSYFLEDGEYNIHLSIDQDYVPNIMCPEGGGYGDYIIMNIDASGQIAKWKIDIEDFKK